MLGYVKIDKGELKVREYEIYCGYYCGICKSIGRRYGQLPRMALSYDAAFLAIFLAALGEAPDEPLQEHCAVHHIQKKTMLYGDAVDYAGDIMLILAWYKLMDDAHDEGKTYAKATMLLLRGIYRKLREEYLSLCETMEKNLRTLSALEDEKCASIDAAAEAFSKIMEAIFTEGVRRIYPDSTLQVCEAQDSADGDGETLPNIAGRIGYHLGKWIYLIDAADDIEDNIETGAYNPLLYRFDYEPGEDVGEFRARIDERLRFNLIHYLAIISRDIEALPLRKNRGILENIIYLGLNRKTEEILTRTEVKKRRKQFHESI